MLSTITTKRKIESMKAMTRTWQYCCLPWLFLIRFISSVLVSKSISSYFRGISLHSKLLFIAKFLKENAKKIVVNYLGLGRRATANSLGES